MKSKYIDYKVKYQENIKWYRGGGVIKNLFKIEML